MNTLLNTRALALSGAAAAFYNRFARPGSPA